MKDIAVEILYKDEQIVVANKPPGILVHPYKQECQDRVSLMGLVRDLVGTYVYPFQRIDRPVSGPVFFGLSSDATKKLQENWNKNETVKEYITLCRREITEKGKFDFPLKDKTGQTKQATTFYQPLWSNGEVTLLSVVIKTGRHHQIRRHFSRRCFNIVGDTTYGKGVINRPFRENHGLSRIFLHCHQVKIIHPYTLKQLLIRCPLAPDLVEVLKSIAVPSEIITGLV